LIKRFENEAISIFRTVFREKRFFVLLLLLLLLVYGYYYYL